MSSVAQAMDGVEVAGETSTREIRQPASSEELQARVLYLASDIAALSASAAELSPAASELIRAAATLLVTAGGQFRQGQNQANSAWGANLVRLMR